MMRISEEQKAILTYYEGGRTSIIRQMKESAADLRSTGQDPEMVELLEDLVMQLEGCTNREFFRVKEERLLDTEEEEPEMTEDGVPMEEEQDAQMEDADPHSTEHDHQPAKPSVTEPGGGD